MKQFSITRDVNELLQRVGQLSNAPLPYDTRKPHSINRQHQLAKLIVWDIHEQLKHIPVKQILTELVLTENIAYAVEEVLYVVWLHCY